ncbi:MAG: hypothetical protein E7081_02655 [Bacteroidales bacterium]|nr:hypothetical protein [Bacteroidales bacterium]
MLKNIVEMGYIKYIGIVIMFIFATSCKTTERNYREAYELAKGAGLQHDSLVANLIANEQAPIAINVGNETMKLKKEYVSLIADDVTTKDVLKQYNIVVGSFRQIFNARSMAARMLTLGYKSYVLSNRTPIYFVAVASTDSLDEALLLYKKAKSDVRVVYKAPFPWVLESVQKVREKVHK